MRLVSSLKLFWDHFMYIAANLDEDLQNFGVQFFKKSSKVVMHK